MKRSRTPLEDADFAALAAFRHALREFLAFSDERAREAGLTPQQHQALLAIRGHALKEPMTVKALAARLLVRHNTAVELVGRLEAAGLVRRTPGAADRRQSVVTLTAAAETRLAGLSELHLGELRERGPRLVEMLTRLTEA